MTLDTAQELNNLSKRIFRLEKQMSDFTEMLHDKQQADIEFVCLETGVDLDIGEDEEPDEFGEEEE